MHHLRMQVKQLQEDALFEQTALRGSLIADEQQPSSNDIDAILRSMMGASIAPPNSQSTPGPNISYNNDFLSPIKPPLDFPSPGLSDVPFSPDTLFGRMAAGTSTPATGRRVTRNKGKARR